MSGFESEISCRAGVSCWRESALDLSSGAGTELSNCKGSMKVMFWTKLSKWWPLFLLRGSVVGGTDGRCMLLSMKLRMSEFARTVGTMTACPSLSCSAISSTMDFVSPKRRNCCRVAISSSKVMMAQRSSTLPATSYTNTHTPRNFICIMNEKLKHSGLRYL